MELLQVKRVFFVRIFNSGYRCPFLSHLSTASLIHVLGNTVAVQLSRLKHDLLYFTTEFSGLFDWHHSHKIFIEIRGVEDVSYKSHLTFLLLFDRLMKARCKTMQYS